MVDLDRIEIINTGTVSERKCPAERYDSYNGSGLADGDGGERSDSRQVVQAHVVASIHDWAPNRVREVQPRDTLHLSHFRVSSPYRLGGVGGQSITVH